MNSSSNRSTSGIGRDLERLNGEGNFIPKLDFQFVSNTHSSNTLTTSKVGYPKKQSLERKPSKLEIKNRGETANVKRSPCGESNKLRMMSMLFQHNVTSSLHRNPIVTKNTPVARNGMKVGDTKSQQVDLYTMIKSHNSRHLQKSKINQTVQQRPKANVEGEKHVLLGFMDRRNAHRVKSNISCSTEASSSRNYSAGHTMMGDEVITYTYQGGKLSSINSPFTSSASGNTKHGVRPRVIQTFSSSSTASNNPIITSQAIERDSFQNQEEYTHEMFTLQQSGYLLNDDGDSSIDYPQQDDHGLSSVFTGTVNSSTNESVSSLLNHELAGSSRIRPDSFSSLHLREGQSTSDGDSSSHHLSRNASNYTVYSSRMDTESESSQFPCGSTTSLPSSTKGKISDLLHAAMDVFYTPSPCSRSPNHTSQQQINESRSMYLSIPIQIPDQSEEEEVKSPPRPFGAPMKSLSISRPVSSRHLTRSPSNPVVAMTPTQDRVQLQVRRSELKKALESSLRESDTLFQPAISELATSMAARTPDEMVLDAVRQKERIEQLRLKQEEKLQKDCPFEPKIRRQSQYKSTPSMLKWLLASPAKSKSKSGSLCHNYDDGTTPEADANELSYSEKLKKIKSPHSQYVAAELQRKEQDLMKECTFKPHITPIPSYITEMSRARFAMKQLSSDISPV